MCVLVHSSPWFFVCPLAGVDCSPRRRRCHRHRHRHHLRRIVRWIKSGIAVSERDWLAIVLVVVVFMITIIIMIINTVSVIIVDLNVGVIVFMLIDFMLFESLYNNYS